jgi:DinB superfamily
MQTKAMDLMRKTLSIAAWSVAAVMLVHADEMTRQERAHLVSHLEMTGSWLIDEVSGLSPEQLAFSPGKDVWSIMEVLEHLVVVGPIYWNDLQKALKSPAQPRDSAPAAGDAAMLWYGIDRTWREVAIPSERPPGRLKDLHTALQRYRDQHAQLIAYARTTKDDLRVHVVERQRCDAYQWALLISTHEQRHVLQIRELKANPRFPGK